MLSGKHSLVESPIRSYPPRHVYVAISPTCLSVETSTEPSFGVVNAGQSAEEDDIWTYICWTDFHIVLYFPFALISNGFGPEQPDKISCSCHFWIRLSAHFKVNPCKQLWSEYECGPLTTETKCLYPINTSCLPSNYNLRDLRVIWHVGSEPLHVLSSKHSLVESPARSNPPEHVYVAISPTCLSAGTSTNPSSGAVSAGQSAVGKWHMNVSLLDWFYSFGFYICVNW